MSLCFRNLRRLFFKYLWGRRALSLNIFVLDLLMSLQERKDRFLLEIQKIHRVIDILVDKYDMRGEVINVMLTGMISMDEFGDPVLKAVYSLDVDNEELLDETFDFIRFSYTFQPEEDHDWESENWYRDILDSLDGIDPSLN